MIIKILLSVVIMAVSAIGISDNKFRFQFKGYKAESGFIDTRTTRSLIGCSKSCSEHSECRSIFYEPTSRDCQRHRILYTNSSLNLSTSTSAMYYEKEDTSTSTAISPTTTTTTTSPTTTTMTTSTVATSCVPTTFTCPTAHMPDFVQYDDCVQTFSFRLYSDVTRSFYDAKTACVAQGGHLFEILTIEKINFARQLVQCPRYKSDYVWIDGEYNGASTRFETSKGEPLPLTQGTFFYTDRPNTNTVGECIWIDPNMNHLMDDATCASGLAYMICEKP